MKNVNSPHEPFKVSSQEEKIKKLEEIFGNKMGDYYIMTEQVLPNHKTNQPINIVYVEDSEGNGHQIFFTPTLN